MPSARLSLAAVLLAAVTPAAFGLPDRGERDPRLLIGSAPWLGPEVPPGLDRLRVDLRLDPAGSRLAGRARVSTEHRRRLDFRLNPALEITALRCGEEDLLGRLRAERGAEEGSGRWELRVPRSCADEDDRVELDFEYAGAFEGEAASLLSEQGARFAPGDAAAPELGGLALHELVLELPPGWSASTPAEARPLGGLALAAGPYRVSRREAGGTELRVLLREEDEGLATAVLDALAVALPRLEAILGPYPGARFDVVESSLGPGSLPEGLSLSRAELEAAVRTGGGPLPRGLARAWLSAEPAAWRDGLALFAAELARSEDAAAKRRRILRGLALGTASPAERSALVFEALRQELGEARFVAALESLTGRRPGGLGDRERPRDRDGLAAAFAAVAGQGPPELVAEWWNATALPRLTLEDLRSEDGVLRGRLRREGPEIPRHVELAITTVDGEASRHRVELTGELTELHVETASPVHAVELDPEAHLPRRLSPREIGPCLARALAAGTEGHELVVAYPIAPRDAPASLTARAERYRAIAERLAAGSGGRAVPAVTLARDEWNASSLVLLGGPEDNPLTARIVDELIAAGFDTTPPGFRAGTRRWLEDGDALLATIAHPDRAGALISVWMPAGDEAMDSAAALDRLGTQRWAVLRDGRVLEAGNRFPDSEATRVELRPSRTPESPAARLRESVERLAAPALEGRGAGTNGSRRTAELVAEAMEEAGLQPWDPRGFQHVFFWLLRDLPRQPKLFRELPRRTGVETYDCSPAAFWLPVPGQLLEPAGNVELRDAPVNEPVLVPLPEGLVWAGSVEEPAFRGLDLRGAAALVLDDTPLPPVHEPRARERFQRERTGRYFELMTEVRRQEGETLIVLRPNDEAPFFPALATYPSLDRERDPRLSAAFARDGELGALREASKRQAGHPPPPVPVRLAFAGADLVDALRAGGALEPGRRWWRGTYLDLRLRVTTERVFDRNLVGLTLGAGRLSDGVVLVGAHHDGLGWDAEGRFHESAVDDAAGTAVLLELARRLAADPPPLTVAFASHGAGHWGDVGARSLAQAWPGHWPLRAALRLLSAGRAGAPVELAAGEGAGPAARVVGSALAEAGLRVVESSPARGPWVRSGVPVVSLRQDGGAGAASSRDDQPSETVDFEELARLVDALEAAVRELASGGDS